MWSMELPDPEAGSADSSGPQSCRRRGKRCASFMPSPSPTRAASGREEATLRSPEGSAADPASLYAPHGRPGRFFNPWRPFDTGLADLLRWKLRPNPYGPRRPPVVPVAENDGAYLRSRG